ncbi:MAG: hypothetical protein QXH56_01435 [Thermoprotei archaeon]
MKGYTKRVGGARLPPGFGKRSVLVGQKRSEWEYGVKVCEP